MTPVTDILARNRDLALSEADVCAKMDYPRQENYARGQANAYSEAIRIIEAAAKPEPVQFRCCSKSLCLRDPRLVDDGGNRWCDTHAPQTRDLTISEHDDPRAER